ncbi:MAG: Ig-like domain-containing protein [Leucobacter sp.]
MVTWIACGVSLALIGTIAVIAAGYDARETPREDPSVWAVRSAGQYARVNTLTAEIDTVRSVEDPSGLLQSGAHSVVLSHGNGRAWNIDPMLPRDLVDDAATAGAATADTAEADTAAGTAADDTATAQRLPDGTRDAVVADDAVLLRTEDGEAYLSRFADSGDGAPSRLGDPVLLDPFADERAGGQGDDEDEPKRFVATAAAIDDDGTVALFSAADHEVRWYSVERGEFTGVDRVPDDISAEDAQLAIVAGRWAILEPDPARLWREGSDGPVRIDASGDPRLQASSVASAGDAVLVADSAGLWSLGDGEASRIAEADGIAAQPIALGAERYAAWLGQAGAVLWADGETRQLQLDDSVDMPGDPEPVIRSSATSALLSEVKTGMLWTVPDGKLIPVEQWSLADPPKDRNGTVVVADVTEQEPPVAVDDSFGVRAGEPAILPVLLNDFDPNRKDVLTIVPEGLGDGLDPEFGAVSMLPDGQSLVIRPAADAAGSMRFGYRITDGVNVSEVATVTLTVADPGENSAPQWCPVDGCRRDWPSPELVPGGTLVLPVLEGWVDPQGDPMMLESATPANPDDPVRALVTADGRLALRHADPNAPEGEIAVRVRVADGRGEATERELVVQVRGSAKAELSPIAATAQVGETSSVRPLGRIVGGSGSYALVDATVQSGEADVAANVNAGAVEVTAEQPGVAVIAITARDLGTDAEIDGVMRVTAVEERPKLALPPMRAFVRPLADTTVDVLDAVSGADGRELVLRGAKTVDGELRADVIEHAQVRVSGSTPDGGAGRIGSVDVTVAEGSDTAVGRLTVFQVPESGEAGAIAVADSITVRAGSIADIPVLDNDVSPPGQRLVLHPEISGSGEKGELAFASGNTLRYLAPEQPGTYTLSYTTYGASTPEVSDVGHVRVTVLPRDGNRDPQPRALTVRLAPGEKVTAQVPLSGVDPDGDRVRLLGVGASDDAQLSATLAPRSSAILVEASDSVEPGTRSLSYSVRDEFGGEAQGRVRVIVTEADPAADAPITYSDYVRLVQGAADPAVVQPLDNDIDPAGGRLQITEVVPNVAGGPDSERYQKLADRLDLSELKRGRVTVKGSDELGTVSYRYTVRSPESKSTADGLIVVQVSARVGQQAPTVRDTVLSARDRTELERGGVDVITDRVFWNAGDVQSLQLSVWGRAADRFTATGNRISGQYRAEGDLVPFRLAGKDLTGAEVESFGFLVIPPLDELRLTLQPGLAPLQVDEGETVDAALADLVDLGPGDEAEFKLGAFSTQRGQAGCEATGPTTLRYSAGREGPWADSCLISVKLTEQKVWTQLPVPVQIVPDEPVVMLEPLTRTVAPGASETIDLRDMVRWEGGREGETASLVFQSSGGGSGFEVSQGGAQVTVRARADAVPGSQDVLSVSVSGAGESSAPLTLRVGEAAKDSPRGATVQLGCVVGSTCQAQLIGAPGEYDPFAGKSGGGLKLESIDANGCAYGSLQLAGNGVSVSWPQGAKGPGGKCTATFTVRDAQNRTGSGTIELDAQGVPRAPVGITPTSADSSSVTLSVALSAEASYPAVSGVELLTGGAAVGSCSLAGSQASCTVTGLRPGEKRTYTARAVNRAGVSDPVANGAQTWAYAPPESPSISADTVTWPENTDSGKGRVKVTIGSTKAPVMELSVNGTKEPASAGSFTREFTAGERISFSVIAADSADMIPPGYTGSDGGRGAAKTATVTPIGAPTTGTVSLSLGGADRTDWTLTASGFDTGGGDSPTYHYSIAPTSGGGESPSGNSSSNVISGAGLKKYRNYTAVVSASNSYGRTGQASASDRTGRRLPDLTGTYTVPTTPSFDGVTANWAAGEITISGQSADGVVAWESDLSASNPNPRVRQCPADSDGDESSCSNWTPVTPVSGSLMPFTLTKKGGTIPRASGGLDPSPETIASYFVATGQPGGTITYTVGGTDGTDVIVSIVSGGANVRDQVTFAGVVEAPPPSETPPITTLGGAGP